MAAHASPRQTSTALATRADELRSGLERSWRAYSLYAAGHNVTDAAFRGLLDLLGESDTDTVSMPLCLEHDQDALADPEDGFAARLRARNIGRLEIDRRATAEDLAAFFEVLRGPGHPDPDVLASEVGARTTSRVMLEPLRYSMLSVGGPHGSPSSDTDAPLLWRRINDALSGVRDVQAAADSLARDLLGQDSAAASEVLRVRVREVRSGEGAPAMEHIRAVLATMPREACERLIWPDETAPALPLDAIAELVDALPVRVMCDALSLVESSADRFCSASALLFKRLATLAAGDGEDMDRVGALARRWAETAPPDAPEAGTIGAVADLCTQASRHDFTPEDYERQLRLISAETGAGPARRRVPWDHAVEERAHADEILLGLVERGEAPAESLAGILSALRRGVAPAADAGRIDYIARAILAAEGVGSDAPAPARAAGEELLASCTGEDVVVRAIGRAHPTDEFPRHADILLNHPRTDATGILLRAYALGDWVETREWIARKVAARGPDLVERLAEAIVREPEMVESLADLVNDLDADDAFRVIGPAILNAPDPLARLRAYAAAYRLRHPWPRGLCHRALTDEDPRIRRLAGAYLKQRRADDCLDLLAGRALHRLGGPAPSDSERASLVDALGRTPGPQATAALAGGLLYAAWRLGRDRAGVGRRLHAALASRPRNRAALLAIGAWTISPNRFVPARPPRHEGEHDD